MNEDFSEIINKFSDILKDKNIDINSITGQNSTCSDGNSDIGIDIDTILKIKDIMSKINKNQNCPRNKLLYSLEPYLKENKKEKLEKYIKIANLLSVADSLNLDLGFLEKNKEGYDLILIITLILLII